MDTSPFAEVWMAYNHAKEKHHDVEKRLLNLEKSDELHPVDDLRNERQQAKKRFDEARNRLLAHFVPRMIDLIGGLVDLAEKRLRNKRQKRQKEDVAQSVVVSVLANHEEDLGKVKKPEELWDLFAAVTLRHCNKHNKRGYREFLRGLVFSLDRRTASGDTPGYEPAASGPSPIEEAAFRALVKDCQKELNEREQRVLELRYAGNNREEITAALKISIPTVDRVLKSIRIKLAKLTGAGTD